MGTHDQQMQSPHCSKLESGRASLWRNLTTSNPTSLGVHSKSDSKSVLLAQKQIGAETI
jgi:hypothetical protein